MGKQNDGNFQNVAAAQGEANQQVIRDQTYANRPNQVSPWGYTSWNPTTVEDPLSGEQVTNWTQTTGLTPELQNILDKQIALMGDRANITKLVNDRMGSVIGSDPGFDNLSPYQGVPVAQFTTPEGSIGDPNQFRQRGADAAYNAAMSRITPQVQEQRRAAEAKMRAQGLSPTDAAWQAQMGQIDQRETDATNQAIWGSEQAGRQEAQQMYQQLMGQNQNLFNQAYQANQANFGQAMQGSQYANEIRQQQLAEEMQKRGFSMNELNAMLSGQQVNMPNFQGFQSAQAAQPAPIYQGALDQYNMRSQQDQSALNAASGVATTAAMLAMSDRRLKRDIKRVGTVKGYPWYTFNYVWGEPGQGVMADEVPEEYTADIGGYRAVDYGKLLER